MNLKIVAIAAVSCLGLAACGNMTPGDTATSMGATQAPSGITSSNGGGQRALGNVPGVGVNSGTGQASVGSVPNTKGAAY